MTAKKDKTDDNNYFCPTYLVVKQDRTSGSDDDERTPGQESKQSSAYTCHDQGLRYTYGLYILHQGVSILHIFRRFQEVIFSQLRFNKKCGAYTTSLGKSFLPASFFGNAQYFQINSCKNTRLEQLNASKKSFF